MKRYSTNSLASDKHYTVSVYLASEADAELKHRDEEVASLRKDAERYRWLRQYNIDSYLACGKLEALDKDIDASMNVPTGTGESNVTR